MKSKILFLPTRYFPSISGAEFYLQRLAEILNEIYGYKVDIFTSNAIDFKALRDPKGKVINKSENHYNQVNNLNINRFPVKYDASKVEQFNNLKELTEIKLLNISDKCLKELLKNGPYIPEILDYFLKSENFNYDVIHSTFFPYFNLLVGLILGNRYKIPVIITPFFHFSNPRYLDSALLDVLYKADLIIACTNMEKEVLIEKTGIHSEKIKVIPMGVDYDKFTSSSEFSKKEFHFKQKYFRLKEKNYNMVLFCGYKNYEKGAISILKSIPYILKKKKKIYFVFIGPSTMAYNREFSKIKKIKNVRIINLTPDNLNGYFDKKKIAAFLETDIYLMPSRTDAFGIAFLEAWAAEKPVIGANIGATPEVIRNNVDGYLVNFDDPFDIAEKVVKLLKSKKVRKKFGTAGKKRVKDQYLWEYIAKKTHLTYQNLINTRE